MENNYIYFFGKRIEADKFRSKAMHILKKTSLIALSLAVGFAIWIISAL